MAGRAIPQLLKKRLLSQSYKQELVVGETSGAQPLRALALLGAGAFGIFGIAPIAYADEAEHGLTYPSYPWPHSGILSLFDQSSIQRGQQIYRSDCAACHGSMMVSYRDLAGAPYTEEVKAEIEVFDVPNVEGKVCTRPGNLSDRFSKAYTNEQGVGFANGGAYAPDLSIITKIREKLHYNPYFPGRAIILPKMLNDGPMVYEDGNPTTEAKMVKMFPSLRGN